MKKRHLLILVVLFSLICIYFKDSIASFSRREISNNLNTEEVFKLQISKKTKKKFDLIYNKYTEDFRSKEYKEFTNFLYLNNDWENAKITYNGEMFDVKIKLHGNTPTQHVEGNFYSLGVKVLNNKKIKGCSRFNLITYWRVRFNADIIKYFSDKIGIYTPKLNLITIHINDKRPKLYYFEHRTNSEYLSSINKSDFIILKYGSDKSVIYTGGGLNEWDKKLNISISELNLTDSITNILYNRYSELNKAIYHKNTNKVLSFFDLGYLAKIQSFRYLFGDNGHGFKPNNLLIAYSLKNNKFYPFIHRDNSPMVLETSKTSSPYNGENIGEIFPLFIEFSKSETLSKKTKKHLTHLLRSEIKAETIDSIIDVHNSYYYSSSLKQFLHQDRIHPSSKNITSLNKLLN